MYWWGIVPLYTQGLSFPRATGTAVGRASSRRDKWYKSFYSAQSREHGGNNAGIPLASALVPSVSAKARSHHGVRKHIWPLRPEQRSHSYRVHSRSIHARPRRRARTICSNSEHDGTPRTGAAQIAMKVGKLFTLRRTDGPLSSTVVINAKALHEPWGRKAGVVHNEWYQKSMWRHQRLEWNQ